MAEYVTLHTAEKYGEQFNGIGVITLNRPPLNALNRAVQSELAAAARAAQDDENIRAVVVYGGEKVFAAGADIKEMVDWNEEIAQDLVQDCQDNLGAISTIEKPTIAAITGYALGGGLEIALAADHRIAGDNVKVGLPEITLGVIPGGGGTQRLVRLIGPAKAKEIIFTGRYISAQEALNLGIVDSLVDPDQVLYEALLWAARFTHAAPLALAAAKRAIDLGGEVELAEGLAIERKEFARLFATKDQKIGMQSFIYDGPGHAKFIGQ